MKFNSIQEFRDKATETDLQELADYLQSQGKKTEALPNEVYNFSYTSASTYLRQQGYQVGRKSGNDGEPEEFIIHTAGPKNFVSKSVVLQTDIVTRLNRLAADNWQYSKKAIINKLLDDALQKYGY